MLPCSWIYEDGDELSLPVECTDKETAMAGVHMCVKSHIYMYRFAEKSYLEAMLSILHTQMRANNQRSYVPDEEKTVAHVNQARELMEHAEHEREIALREEKIRYEFFSLP
ncbi:spectrin beta chain-like isoform X2 [Dysidea avara]|uniref:spectrin beta chain-like isoform X2 n=1 Tax=Dysidea avara TaxID=196820 RepID=UPI00331BCC38